LPNSKNSKQIVKSSTKWKYLLKDAKLSANKVHVFKNNLMKKDKINFIKINIFPDGGISRFRIYGKSI
jgi:allantoicase